VNNRKTSTRLERRAERASKQVGAQPRPQRQRRGAPRTPVKVGGGSRFNWTLIGGGLAVVVIALLLVYVVIQSTSSSASQPDWIKAELDDSPNLPGKYIKPNPGPDGVFPSADDRQHFGNGVTYPICTQEQIDTDQISTCYNSNPPTSGPHASSPAQFKILDNPAPKENMLHTMEHGGVVVWYNTDDPQVIDQLKSWVTEELNRKKLVSMTKYTDMEPNTIALTAWTRLDKFPVTEMTKKRVVDFIEAHSKRFNPEGF
jgi:hypothetical protein